MFIDMNLASATATGEFSARKDWGYFSPYTNANKYLKLGWDLMAVNAQAETTWIWIFGRLRKFGLPSRPLWGWRVFRSIWGYVGLCHQEKPGK
jgi:hypothetical protein